MRRSTRVLRLAIVANLAVTVASGCSWFRRDDAPQAGAARPLEMPPELDLAGVRAAAQGSVTASSMGGASPAAAAEAGGFSVRGERDAVFNRVGDALAAIDGLSIASRAQLLGAYDVTYEGASFLVRVTATSDGVYVSAVDPRGQAASGEAPKKVLAALKAALGG